MGNPVEFYIHVKIHKDYFESPQNNLVLLIQYPDEKQISVK